MKIAILADPIDGQYAGIHVYTKELVRAVLKYDKNNEYILIRQKKGNEYPGIKQIVVPNLPIYTGFQVLRFFLIFPLILRKLKVDAVLEPAHFGPFNLPKRIKRITVIHDLTPIMFPSLHRWYSQTLQRIFLKGILQRADLILTNSDNTSSDVENFIPGSKTKTHRIYLGKDELFKPGQRADVIEKYKLGQPYFLFTGTLEPRKNLVVLLRAYTDFRKKSNKNISLIVVGKKGWKANEIMEELQQHPYKENIQQLGYVERGELPTLYSRALAFIYPSIYEGFGLPVLEAMACGTPCILSEVSSLPEVGGSAALYFDPKSKEGLAKYMVQVANDPGLQTELRKNSLEQAARFSWKLYAESFIKIIEKIK